MKIGKLEVKADRFPWQLRSFNWATPPDAPPTWGWRKCGGMGRFGGGWDYKFGISVGGSTAILELGIGMLRVSYK